MGFKTKVFVLDDEEINLILVKEILEENGKYLVKETTNVHEAFEIIYSFFPDIILLDITMPDLDGYEVCKKLREDNKFKFTKIIMLSGRVNTEDRLKAYKVGADDYITKPFDTREFLAKINIFSRLKKVEEIEKIKTDLLMLFSHETRTPLNGIFGVSQIFQYDQNLNSHQKEMVEILVNSSNRLKEFFDKAIFLCKLKADVDLNIAPFDIENCLIGEIENFKLSDVVLEKNINFDFECEKELIINIDWYLIRKAINYILENAIKFSPDSGVIKIACFVCENNAVIEISDQGTGIEPEFIEKIFEEFAIKDVVHHHKGLGLSLAISKLIAQNHGGSLEAKNLKPTGAKFILKILLGS